MGRLQPVPHQDIRDLPEPLKLWFNQVLNFINTSVSSFINFRTYTTNTSLTVLNDGYVMVDATTAPLTITLSSAVTQKRYHIKKIDNSANAVTISRTGSDLIEGVTTKSLATQYKSFTLYSDGVNKWYIESST